jgi:hypothetical protein
LITHTPFVSHGTVPIPGRKAYDPKKVWKSALIAGVCGIVGFVVTVLYSDNALLGVFGLVAFPFALAFWKTRNFSDAAVLTWMNEIFVGGGGAWIKLGVFSGRWLLLMIVLMIWMMSPRRGRTNFGLGSTSSVLFFGLALPFLLVFYSLLIKENDTGLALGDVSFLVSLLIYFPLRELVKARWECVCGWLLGTSVVVWMYLMAMCMGPLEVRAAIVRVLLADTSVGRFSSGVDRVTALILVILFFPIFMAILSATKRHSSWWRRAFLLSVAIIAMLPLIVIFIRGPIISIVVVLLFMGVWEASHARNVLLLVRALAVSAVLILVVTVTLLQTAPEWYYRATVAWETRDRSWLVDDARSMQSASMWEALMEEPVLGKGVGAPLLSFHNELATYFELQYNMLLYRFGVVAFGVFVGGLLCIFMEPFRHPFRRMASNLVGEGLFGVSLWASIMCILVVGSMDPYLRTPFSAMFVALYLSMRERFAIPAFRKGLHKFSALPQSLKPH